MKKTSIGGQALIEGIMMKGPNNTALAVRHTGGEIIIEPVKQTSIKQKYKFLGWPILRGICGFIESLVHGYSALMRSADLSGMTELEEQEENRKKAEKAAKKAQKKGQAIPAEESAAELIVAAESAETAQNENGEESKENKSGEKISSALLSVVMVIGVVLGLALSVVLFMWLPAFIFDSLQKLTGGAIGSGLKPLIEGVLKIAIFIGYLILVSQTKDIKRVFQYHGAEHKTIFCYESGQELTVENCRGQSRFHPRCGTSFMVLMLFVGILLGYVILVLFPSIKNYRALWVAVKILLIPLVCGLGYELIKICGRYDNALTRIIATPGLWVQRITTKEPDDSMLEVAIAAIKEVIPENPEDDQW